MFPTSIERGHYEMMVGVCLSVDLSVCLVPRPNSRTEMPRKLKVGGITLTRNGESEIIFH